MEPLLPKDFEADRLRRPGVYVVLFTADWCPFCRSFFPLFRTLEHDPRFTAAEANLTEVENPLWEQFDIAIVPSVLVFRAGRVTLRLDGIGGVGLDESATERARSAATGVPSP